MASTSTLVSSLDPPQFNQNALYAHLTRVPLSDTATLITIAGQVAIRPADRSVPATLPEQVDVCLERLALCLDTAGATIPDLTRLMYYVTERGWAEEGAAAALVQRATRWLRGHRPACCLLVVKALAAPEYLCEFEAQAVVRTLQE